MTAWNTITDAEAGQIARLSVEFPRSPTDEYHIAALIAAAHTRAGISDVWRVRLATLARRYGVTG